MRRSGPAACVAVAAIAAAFGAGCVVGKTVDYAYRPEPPKHERGHGERVVVAYPKDDRERAKTKGGKHVGTMRSGVGVPWSITTESGLPFAQHLGQAFVDELIALGFKAKLLPEPPLSSKKLAAKLKGADRGLKLTISEWHHDTYVGTKMAYEVKITLVDASGAVLYDETFSDKIDIEGKLMREIGGMKAAAMSEYAKAVRRMVRKNKELLAALRGEVPVPTPVASPGAGDGTGTGDGLGSGTGSPSGLVAGDGTVCTPACRAGFVCVGGTCVSACNPVCAAGEKCTAEGTCVKKEVKPKDPFGE